MKVRSDVMFDLVLTFPSFNPFPNRVCTILRPPQIQRSCRQQTKCGYESSFRYRMHIEIITGKGEIAHLEQFHLFPQCFPKVFFFNEYIWRKGLTPSYFHSEKIWMIPPSFSNGHKGQYFN